MFDLLATPAPEDHASTGELLRAAREAQQIAQREEARILALAYEWAIAHPALDDDAAASFSAPGVDDVAIAGEGCPQIREYAVAEFGAVLSMSTASAKRLIGHAIELHHRLPRLWTQVQSGRCPAWRARTVAEATIHAHPRLTPDAAGWIDTQVAAVAGKVGPAQLERLVADAIQRHHLAPPPERDPELLDELADHTEHRHLTIDTHTIGFAGTMHLEGDLDIADALDLDHALRLGAAHLATLGNTGSLDARRALALGDLVRRQLSLDLTHHNSDRQHATHPAGDSKPAPARRLDLHLRLTAIAGLDGLTVRPTAALDQRQQSVLLDHIKAWATNSFTEVRILPILDLAEQLTTPAYVPGPRLRRQIEARDTTCVFPWCTRPATGCDLDHIQPYDPDADPTDPNAGVTSTANLAALCRRHHRLKTHTSWTYQPDPDHPPGAGIFIWTSPHGHHYQRDRTGTTPLTT